MTRGNIIAVLSILTVAGAAYADSPRVPLLADGAPAKVAPVNVPEFGMLDDITVDGGMFSTDRFGYEGVVTRYATLTDAQSETNPIEVTNITDRDAAITITRGYGEDRNIIMGSWWYTLEENCGADQGTAGFGNVYGNSGVGFVQLYDSAGVTDMDVSMEFQDYDGSYWTEFVLHVAGESANYGNAYARFWVEYQGGGADVVVYHSYDLTLTAGGLEGVEGPSGVIEATNHPTSVTGTYTGIFENVSTSYPENNGFYRFDLTLNTDCWAYDNRADLTPEIGYGCSDYFDGTFSDSYFLATSATGVDAEPYPFDESNPRSVQGDAPDGWGDSCWQGPADGKSNYHVWFEDVAGGFAVTLEDLFGAGHGLTVADIESISFFTKKATGILADRDWWLTVYTQFEGDGDDSGSWYDSRVHARPDVGPGYSDSFVYDQWNLWTTGDGAPTNQLVFYDSQRGFGGYYATVDQLGEGPIDWDGDSVDDHDYSDEAILSITLQTDSGWDGFDGLIDGLVVTLTDGRIGAVNMVAGPTDAWVDNDYADNSPGDYVNWPDDGNPGPYVVGYNAFASIQDAIDAVTGSTVYVAAGEYHERLSITSSVEILGEDEAEVIVDAAAGTSGSYGIDVRADDVTIKRLTLVGDTAQTPPRYGFKVYDMQNLVLEDVTAKEFYRSGVDLLCVTNATLLNVTSIDNGGHGFSIGDSHDVTVTGATALNNAWSPFSIVTWGEYCAVGTDGIVIEEPLTYDGDFFQIEMGDYSNPTEPPAGDALISYSNNIADGADLTVPASFTHALHGAQDDGPPWARIYLYESLGAAAAIAAAAPVGHLTGEDMYIEPLNETDILYVTPGCSIQAAVDAAEPGYTIDVAAGTYDEKLTIDIPVNLLGEDGAVLDGTGLGLVAGVSIHSGDVTFDNIDVMNFGGNGIIVGYEPGGPGDLQNVVVSNCAVAHIRPGSSHGFGIYVGYESEGFAGTLTDFLNYSGLEVSNNEVYDTAAAAIVVQSVEGVSGPLVVSGNHAYDSDQSGLWLDSCKNIAVTDNVLENNSNGIFISAYADGAYEGNPNQQYDTEDVLATGNVLQNNAGSGVAVYDGFPATFEFHYNTIRDNGSWGFLKWIGGSDLIDAEYNNWGAGEGPEDTAGTYEVSPGDCGSDPVDMINVLPVGELGNAASEGVDYCPWSFPTLSLLPQGGVDCYAEGDTVVVELFMSDVVWPENIVAVDFFLAYDDSVLQLDNVAAGDAPFTYLYYNISGSGTIDAAVGVPAGDPGTLADTVMARITFTVLAGTEDCDLADLVTFRTHEPPTKLSDAFANPVYPALLDLAALSIDNTPPAISGTVTSGDLDADCEAVATVNVTVTDNCAVALGDVSYTIAGTDCDVDTSGVTAVQTDDTTVTISGTVSVYNVSACTATVTIDVDAIDCPGNAATHFTTSGDWTDNTDPAFVGFPADVTQNADAGECTAVLDPAIVPPTGIDNCDGTPTITYERSDDAMKTLADPFPVGDTTITWRVEDDCGNFVEQDQTVTINGVSYLDITVDLDQTFTDSPVERCITFEVWDCSTTPETVVVYEEVVTFTNGVTYASGTATIEVACDGAWTCITARDRLHTLRRTVAVADAGVVYEAGFTQAANKHLLSGNFNDDRWIDVLDYGVYTWQWAMNYGTPDTDCATPYPHADASGDGAVTPADFTVFIPNYLLQRDPNCCGVSGMVAGDDQPVTEISVDELIARGMPELAVADLNGDGWLDSDDVIAFVNGARPGDVPDEVSNESRPDAGATGQFGAEKPISNPLRSTR